MILILKSFQERISIILHDIVHLSNILFLFVEYTYKLTTLDSVYNEMVLPQSYNL